MTPEQQTPASVVEALGALRWNFERIAALHPNDQPCYPAGSERSGRPFGTGDLRHFIASLTEAAALIERLSAERDEAQAENSRWLLRMEAIREASGVGVLPMLSELPDAIAAKMAGLSAEREGLEAAMSLIRAMTDPADEDNYRADDREGCLDAVHDAARAALTQGESRQTGGQDARIARLELEVRLWETGKRTLERMPDGRPCIMDHPDDPNAEVRDPDTGEVLFPARKAPFHVIEGVCVCVARGDGPEGCGLCNETGKPLPAAPTPAGGGGE